MSDTVDLNADMGESFGPWVMGQDAELLEVITSANVACGFHASDPDVMARTMRLAVDHATGIGAHPGFRDLLGFGRRAMPVDPTEMCSMLAYQLGAMQGIATSVGHKVTHVSYHAAYGNAAVADEDLANAMAAVIARVDRDLILYSQPDTAVERSARKAGLRVITLFLADRAYRADGSLVPRGLPGAVVTDHAEVAKRVERFARDGSVICEDGSSLAMRAKGVLEFHSKWLRIPDLGALRDLAALGPHDPV